MSPNPASNGMSVIEQNVVAVAYVIHAARVALSAVALKFYVFGVSLYALGRLVWVSHVVENFRQVGFQNDFHFMTYAVLHTHTLVQLALLVAIAAFILFLADSECLRCI